MARGGFRIGAGRKKGSTSSSVKKNKNREIHNDLVAPTLSTEDTKKAADEGLDPLTYMLKVMNDPNEDKNRRDRMAVSAAPFCHPRKGEGTGKKEEQQNKARKAGKGKFSPGNSPLKVVK